MRVRAHFLCGVLAVSLFLPASALTETLLAEKTGLTPEELAKPRVAHFFESVNQRTGELLLGTAVAGVHFLDTQEVWILTDGAIRWDELFAFDALLRTEEQSQGKDIAVQSFSVPTETFSEELSLERFLQRLTKEQRTWRNRSYIVKVPHSFREESPIEVRTQLTARATSTTVFREDFSGDVWSRWTRLDNTGGVYTWGVKDCSSYDFHADAPRGGSLGALLDCAASYPPNLSLSMRTQVCYPVPADASYLLSLYTKGKFSSVLDSDDHLGVYFRSTNGQFVGWYFYGDWSYTWYELIFNLRQFSGEDLALNSCNTLSLGFESDENGADNGFGARVDDVEFVVGYPVCTIMADPPSGTAPLTVSFRVVDGSSSSFWRFGDGSTSREVNPAHIFHRAGKYSVTYRGGSSQVCFATKTIQVSAGSCSYSVSPQELTVPAAGGLVGVEVTTGSSCRWQATSEVSWAQIQGSNVFTGNGLVTYRVDPNTTTGSREGQLFVAAELVTIRQPSSSCSYTVQPTSISVPPGGGTYSVQITTGSQCPWSVSGLPTWVSAQTTSGTGSATVNLTVAANPTASTRSASITVAGQLVLITQQGSSCQLSLSQTQLSVPAQGGTFSVSLTAPSDCSWTASSSSSWIQVTPSSGTGSATLQVSVAANTGAARAGTVTVGNAVLTVQQAAATSSCTYRALIPVMARATGMLGSQWRTELVVTNPRNAATSVKLRFVSKEGQEFTQTQALGPLSQLKLEDTLASLAPGYSGSGWAEICSDQYVAVISRTYNLVGSQATCNQGGTFGQLFEGLNPQSLAGPGAVIVLPGLAENSQFRSNLGFFNPGTADISVRVTLFSGNGQHLQSFELSVPAQKLITEDRVFFKRAGRSDIANGWARVEVLGAGNVYVYGSVIDNITNAPVTITPVLE